MSSITYRQDGECWITDNGHLFNSEAKAASYCAALDAYVAAMAPVDALSRELSRSEYEAACTALGAEILSDDQCDDYAVRHGVFSAPEYAVAVCMQMALAKKRLAGLKAERRAQPKPAPREVVMVRCDCGHSVPKHQVMRASMGTSCPDCYDRMSDRY